MTNSDPSLLNIKFYSKNDKIESDFVEEYEVIELFNKIGSDFVVYPINP